MPLCLHGPTFETVQSDMRGALPHVLLDAGTQWGRVEEEAEPFLAKCLFLLISDTSGLALP